MLPSEILKLHRPTCERVSYCVETPPPSQPPPQDRSLSITLLSFLLCVIFCPISFQREWAAFLDAWCLPPGFRSCFVEVAQRSNDLLVNLSGRKWSPHPTPPPSCLTNRFKALDLIDRVPEEPWMEVLDIVKEAVIKTILKKKKSKKAKWLSEEALQIAVKRREVKAKEKRKVIPIWMQSSKE